MARATTGARGSGRSGADGIWGLYPEVIAEYIVIDGHQEPHTPPEFNKARFMRYRYDTRTPEPPPARAVIIGQPGTGAFGSTWYELAAQTVDAGKGQIEFWVIDRREKGLEDSLGLQLAADAMDPLVGRDYYFGGAEQHRTLNITTLTNEDVPFMAHWGVEVIIGDMACILDLVPADRQATNVYLIGHSLGGGLCLNFAGYQFPDGKAGFERLAGLVLLEAGPPVLTDKSATVAEWRAAVEKLISGESRRFTSLAAGNIHGALNCMSGFWDPEGESPYRLRNRGAVGGAEANEFLKQLRVTNEALAVYLSDDDGIPGSMTQDERGHITYVRCGRLDFPALDEPGVPPLSAIDPEKVHGWISGGAGNPAGETDDGPLNGFPTNQRSWWLRNPPNPNPTTAYAMCLGTFFGGARTNLTGPTTYRFPESGELTISTSGIGHYSWYFNVRLMTDHVRAGSATSTPEMNITRKADIDIPMISYGDKSTMELAEIPFQYMDEYAASSKVTDWTEIGPDGVTCSPEAEKLTTFPAGTNTRFYNHSDLHSADNSRAGAGTPGEIGCHVVTNTLIPWLLARAEGTTAVPTPASLGIEETPDG